MGPRSVYRSIKTQLDLWNSELAKAKAEFAKNAKEGQVWGTAQLKHQRSMVGDPTRPDFTGGGHMSGLGFDFNMGYPKSTYVAAYLKKHPGTKKQVYDPAYRNFMHEKSALYEWLTINAAFFGFYNYFTEPWHWEFNPADFTDKVAEPPVSVVS